MATFTAQPPAKVNLGLFIKGRRPDGYHNLQTVFLPVPQLHDVLTITPTPGANGPSLEVAGVDDVDLGLLDDNLCIRAWHALKGHYAHLQPVHIHLTKHIPTGAGLGGGSSDAAHTLRGLIQLFQLHISKADLVKLSAGLGADVPFFLFDGPMYAEGIGEQLSPINLPLEGYSIKVITPAIHSSTAEAYRGLDLAACHTSQNLRSCLQQPLEQWRHCAANDFEPSVFARFPALASIKQQLYAEGAIYAAMSGSGSAIFGLFPK